MQYDIVPIQKKYRGMGRNLTGLEYTPKEKKEFEDWLNKYYEYLDACLSEEEDDIIWKHVVDYYMEIKDKQPCEIIVWDTAPLESVFGYTLELLGIDIVHEERESLLENIETCKEYSFIDSKLNENGLCRTVEDVEALIPLLDHGNVEWKTCYVYKAEIIRNKVMEQDCDFLEYEKELKENSQNSTEELLRYILFEMRAPIEDYYLAIDLLKENYPKNHDIRFAILGAYLTSTWFSFKKNDFLEFLDTYLEKTDNQNKAIIYYLHAYDIWQKMDKCFPRKYPKEYGDYLQKSISCSERFVFNYVRLAEISTGRKAHELLGQAIANVEKVWDEEQLKKLPDEHWLKYDTFINEFILGVEMNEYSYKDLFKDRDLPWNRRILGRYGF